MFEYYFYLIFKFLVIFSAVMVILARNPIYSVLFLVLVFCNSAGLVILLGAEFLAFVFIVVYVGAIAVLFLFVVMMINFKMVELQSSLLSYFPLSAYIIAILAAEFKMLLSEKTTYFTDQSVFIPYVNWFDKLFNVTNTEALGFVLYTHYSIIFLIAGFILLIAMVGSIALTMLYRSNMKRQDIYYQAVRSPSSTVRKFS